MNTMSAIQAAEGWRDGKRYLWLLSPFIPVLGATALGLANWTGWYGLAWLAPFLVYGFIPLLDWLIGVDNVNAPEWAVAQLENDRYYRAIVYAYLPLQLFVTVFAAWCVVHHALAWWEYLGMILAAGAVNGIGINTAHELGHKTNAPERWLAKLTLAPVAYGHFFVEHNKGHHKNVATPGDPASSKMGETFWAFLPRTMIGSLRSAWGIEKERLARKGKGPWSVENDNLQAWAMTVVLYAALVAWLGWAALPFLLLQAFYGASLLEVINYIEHYGLLRQKGADGRYERCTPAHSWNSNHIVTNLFLYQLQRHSDHHANPTRRFQALRHFDDSPQLPSGYASMLIPAYIPALWFRQMDPLVVRHYRGELGRANLYPPRREALLRRWSRPQLDDGHPAPFPRERPAAAGAGAASRYQCGDCGYIYDEARGCPREGFAPGTLWERIPDHWACPDCAVREKVDFVPLAEDEAAPAR
jgi:alkane 1-monooxygenase